MHGKGSYQDELQGLSARYKKCAYEKGGTADAKARVMALADGENLNCSQEDFAKISYCRSKIRCLMRIVT